MQTSAVYDYHLAENLEIDCLSEARWWVDMNARAGDEAIFAQMTGSDSEVVSILKHTMSS
ncbi:hypothetical protein AGABI2DRAFT_137656 [Agaricus bisporus var. bisporus H97]|uniref:hypothetical protein n=1 Tax=Agaricus bisporus var. bisporus (strain H97 / ATCC MYA-4626 / FGSC 10389) TaxID=936046 RepID=UPI00029F7D34|nr:hypothetical protein AGABI2DRAFT_137648 [Agaricus bisporus var. bisporus H97]XP_006463182.1 hypothetical protein AGABI2DRAFT_137656 [Agaricus bisporus var. bisporus H97]EKV45026.1 hypothetical protein AGABI2DRAFT_137648 [Agaricus bisporus var. bisporus H97]EKV45037.1 hypothetical protein AGABI2DRAFT_137656 [Agaricus bisporus var. bisporus H97]